jgi:copper chaperone CopZ
MRLVSVAPAFNYTAYSGVLNPISTCKLTMATRKYKTNINCGNCVKAVTGFLSDVPGIDHWEVDTTNPDKILSVSGADFDESAVVEAVEDAGFDIHPVEVTN